MKRMILTKNEVIDYSKNFPELSDISLIVRPGVNSVIVFNNNPANLKAKVASHANLTIINFIQNVKQMDTKVLIDLNSNGAQANVYYAFHGRSKNKHTFNITMRHQAKNTKGDILIKAVYEGNSFGKFFGMIKIDKKAQKTDSYFADHVLLLDKGMGVSVPKLEIEADDVKASHRSTTGKINADQLFYLTSRGLPSQQAKKMIIDGFFEPIFVKLPKGLSYEKNSS